VSVRLEEAKLIWKEGDGNGGLANSLLGLLLCVGTVILASTFTHRRIETPMRRRLRRLL